jgi:hypothetical protein
MRSVNVLFILNNYNAKDKDCICKKSAVENSPEKYLYIKKLLSCNIFGLSSSYKEKRFLMKLKMFVRLFVFVLLVSASLAFISYTHTKTAAADNKECTDGEKCCQKKVQTEFILWESISRNLFGNNS